MFTLLAWIFFSLVVGAIGADRTIGFWGSFFISLLLSPVIGFIIVLFYKSNATAAAEIKSRRIQEETLEAIKNKPEKNIAEELQKLSDLKENGVLDDQEFLVAKQKLLSN